MKKKYIAILFCLFLLPPAIYASTIQVNVINFQFSPADVTAQVGDVIQFNFVTSGHNASSAGDVIPDGAAEINSGGIDAVATYSYTLNVAGEYNYHCDAHISMTGTITASNPLPVTLKNFMVSAGANGQSLLKWSTVTEQNTLRFEVRSSTDGKYYKTVANISAAGNSNTEKLYSYTDNLVNDKFRYVFYQLTVVDKDGKETYSKVVVYKNMGAKAGLITQLGPNPIKKPGQLSLQFNAEKAGYMHVRVISTAGKLVSQTKLQATPGLNNGHLHVCEFDAGTYTVLFSYEGQTETRKIVVQ